MSRAPAAVPTVATLPAPAASPDRWRALTGHPLRGRAVVGVAVLVVALLVGAVLSLTAGRLGVPIGDLPSALAGTGSRAQTTVLTALRLPRLGVAVAAGAALGAAGAVFQSVTRNPLGSPDVIGLGAGAAAGAAAAALVWPGVVPVAVGALIGSVLATVAVVAGAGGGATAPLRMVVVGIGVAAMALAFVQYALSRARLADAQQVDAWLHGGLDGRRVADVTLVAVALVVLLPLALALSPRLQLLEMGDDAATGLGVRPGRTRAAAVVVGVLLTTAAVTASGPITFVALAAPQIARRLLRSTGPGMAAAALTGATLLVLADVVAQNLPLPVRLPVGIVTAALGGVYLAALLVREWRKGTV
ncbi:FecCD family ABC transporter permease [Cellulomonas aerilata]|uniref:ABC transporter permease n=1 Tax=Cellulomonas aerilata TaxID=515326 RepID=A0A512D726_9CELL|nr:iron chelate uptake ABC transporter family permease subunit [Cellulomonas aerilata]GEO32279.1 ABC transporter permease [Cellulomonas aerilata]